MQVATALSVRLVVIPSDLESAASLCFCCMVEGINFNLKIKLLC